MKPIAVLGLTALTLSCSFLVQVGRQSRIGIITGVHGDDPHLSVPDTVEAEEPFSVTVRTYGPGDCWEHDRTDVDLEGLDATVTPFDSAPQDEGATCPGAIQEFTHTATFDFGRPGTAQVTVLGATRTRRRVLALEHTVVVR